MKANELRIGNYVMIDTINKLGVIVRVISIENGHILATEEKGAIQLLRDVKDVKPIPLTKELLLKCGMKISFKNETGELYKFVVKGFLVNPHITVKYGNPITFRSREIYLHDLQNIYYVLTGEELEVKF